MKTFRAGSIWKMLLVILGCLALFGCASFPGNELPKYTYEQLAVPAEKVAIDYDARFLTMGHENAAAVRIFQEEIDKVFRNSQLFASHAPGVGTAPYHLSLTLENKGDTGGAAITGFLSGLTLTILPGFAKDEYVLTADIKQGDTLLKQYRYQDHMNTWIQLFMIFAMPTHLPKDKAVEVIDNMLLNLLADLQKDGLLKPQVAAAQ